MKFPFRGASGVALLLTVASGTAPAWSQDKSLAVTDEPASPASAAPDDAGLAEVVVTGSYIRGTPVDAALPVEVYSQEALEKQGSPTALEFAKSLTIAGPTTGESYYFGGPQLTGSVQYNLRGLGADKTLILLNGRRTDINTANIPSIALERTEILKDGAAVIYGADATGGVVNFITRDHFVGLQTSSQYKYIDGSAGGDYSAGVLAGVGEDRVNLMFSAEYEHRSRLHALARDFTHAALDPTQPGYNSAPWSTFTNLAGWLPLGPLPAVPSVANEFGTPVGGIVSDFTPASCAAVGGRYDNNFTCAYDYIPYYNLVEKNNIYRAYAQLNAKVTDDAKFHLEASYGQVIAPQVFGSPAQPMIRGPAMNTGSTFQFYVPITNPYAAAFAAKNGITGASGFSPVTYRLLAHGGNFAFGDGNGYGVPDRIDNKVWRVSTGLNGVFGDWARFAKNVGYDFAITFNQSNSFNTHADTIGYRLQEALDGFGGPDCHAEDLDPTRFGTQNPAAAGKNGCLWWNPFSSSFAGQPVLGLSNPNYVPGSENSAELTRWLFDPRGTETINRNFTTDLVFNGSSGIALPGGEVGWALGGQLRQVKTYENVSDPLFDGSTPCEWPQNFTSANGAGSPNLPPMPLPTTDPNFRGCTPDSPGPFVLFAPNPPDSAGRHQYSVFTELQIPVTRGLNFQAAARHEEFSGGLGATVYKLAGKWNVWGPLSFRGSYGTNYQTPPLGVVPGAVTVAARTYTVANSNWLAAQFVTTPNLKPETAKSWNLGAIWQSRGVGSDHRFQLILDYFNIRTKDQIGQIADPNQIASLVFNGPGGTITTCDPAQQPLLNRITFNAGCTVGMSGVGTFSSVTTLFGNGPGQSTSGFDLQTTYDMPLGRGDLALDLTATRVTKLETGPTQLDGVVVSTGDNRLGTLNFATFAQSAPKWRANFAANYHFNQHNVRIGVSFVSAVRDERAGIQYGEDGADWVTTDVTYLYEFDDSLSLTATLANAFDRDPPPAQEEFGYDPWTANPLGRTLEVGIRKRF
ncbi:MAG TPA: TonB-dependent receptor [Steroidobacteraceae bacterium]|nr:TonB-dependent receptor [Steroidobacteraceae bacterium]